MLDGFVLNEKPLTDAVEQLQGLWWCSNLHFSDFQSADHPMGFVGRCVEMLLQGYDEATSAGAQIPGLEGFMSTKGISFVYVPQTNVLKGQLYMDTDKLCFVFGTMVVNQCHLLAGRFTTKVT